MLCPRPLDSTQDEQFGLTFLAVLNDGRPKVLTSQKELEEVRACTTNLTTKMPLHIYIYIHTHTYMHTYVICVYIYIYIYICVCVCIYMSAISKPSRSNRPHLQRPSVIARNPGSWATVPEDESRSSKLPTAFCKHLQTNPWAS